MASTGEVLALIDALHILLKNFPMDILDNNKGKVYTSAFDFIIDILISCGVPMSEITETLLEKIYSIRVNIDDLTNIVENNYLTDSFDEKPTPFLESLENSVKGIIMSLLSSVFGCSAIPVIPNKYIDAPDENIFNTSNLKLWKKGAYPQTINIPISFIDPMGILEFTPTSSEGRLYYMVEGRDVYLKKEYNDNKRDFSILGAGVTKNIPLYLTLDENKNIIFNIDSPLNIDLNISVGYIIYDDNNLCSWNATIRKGEIESDKKLNLQPENKNHQLNSIKWITLNKNYKGLNTDCGWVYLSYEKSIEFIEHWIKNTQSVEKDILWGNKKENENILGYSTNEEYLYEECGYSKKSRNAVRISKPIEATENTPEYIVCYSGITQNELYKTKDMNAFLWYCIKKGNSYPQVEMNKMMWDTRLHAHNEGKYNLKENEQWNNWLNSKKVIIDGEKYNSSEFLNTNDDFYPILQIKPITNGFHGIAVSFPAQTYYKPKARNGVSQTKANITPNSSLYKFNWDYLQSIQIFKPKLMLAGLCRYLLGFTMATTETTNINLTKKLIERKLSTAIKKIIEADDMEIEDCYTTFSNEEFDELLQNMLLSKYNSTYYGGETTTIKNHDIEDYINSINSINDKTEKVDNTEIIKKLITDITVDPGTEESIDYGIQLSTEGNIINNLAWALTMPIIESLFTPQLMLLLTINYAITGVVKTNEFAKNDLGLLMNLTLNKILGLSKSIVKFIKDAVIQILLEIFFEKVMPLIVKYMLILAMERLNSWQRTLLIALSCLPKIKFPKRNKITYSIDDVNYADIINNDKVAENRVLVNNINTIDYEVISSQLNGPESIKPC